MYSPLNKKDKTKMDIDNIPSVEGKNRVNMANVYL